MGCGESTRTERIEIPVPTDHRSLVLLVQSSDTEDQIRAHALVDGVLAEPSSFPWRPDSRVYAWSSPSELDALGLREGMQAAPKTYDAGAHLPRTGLSYLRRPGAETEVIVARPDPLERLRLPVDEACPVLAPAALKPWSGGVPIAAVPELPSPGTAPTGLLVLDGDGGAFRVPRAGEVVSLRTETEVVATVSAAAFAPEGMVISNDPEGTLLKGRLTQEGRGLSFSLEGFLIAHEHVEALAAEDPPSRGVWALTRELKRERGRVEGFVERFEKDTLGALSPQRALLVEANAERGPSVLFLLGEDHLAGAWAYRAGRVFELKGSSLSEYEIMGLSALGQRGRDLLAGTEGGALRLARDDRTFDEVARAAGPVRHIASFARGYFAVAESGSLTLLSPSGEVCPLEEAERLARVEFAAGVGRDAILIGTREGQWWVQVWQESH